MTVTLKSSVGSLIWLVFSNLVGTPSPAKSGAIESGPPPQQPRRQVP